MVSGFPLHSCVCPERNLHSLFADLIACNPCVRCPFQLSACRNIGRECRIAPERVSDAQGNSYVLHALFVGFDVPLEEQLRAQVAVADAAFDGKAALVDAGAPGPVPQRYVQYQFCSDGGTVLELCVFVSSGVDSVAFQSG